MLQNLKGEDRMRHIFFIFMNGLLIAIHETIREVYYPAGIKKAHRGVYHEGSFQRCREKVLFVGSLSDKLPDTCCRNSQGGFSLTCMPGTKKVRNHMMHKFP